MRCRVKVSRIRMPAFDWIETKGTADVARLVIVHRHPPHNGHLEGANIATAVRQK